MEAAEILREQLYHLQKQYGEAERKIDDLEKDNFTQREELREARSKVESLEKVAPPEGSVILKPADAERWQQYQELGKVDEVKAALESKSTAEQELNTFKRRDLIRSAGFNPPMLERLLNGAELKAEGEGEDRVYNIVTKDAEGNPKPVSLQDWAKAEGISDLLNVARLEPKPAVPDVVIQDGREKQARVGPLTPEAIREQKLKQGQYNNL